MSVSKIAESEGTSADDVRAAVNYVLECVHRHRQGLTLNQRPYVLWNEFTKRHDFLKIRHKYQEMAQIRDEETDHENKRAFALSAQATPNPQTPAALPTNPAEPSEPELLTPQKVDKKGVGAAKAKVEAKPNPPPPVPEPKQNPEAAGTEEALTPEDQKKAATKTWNKLKQLKLRAAAATCLASELQSKAAHDSTYDWAKGSDIVKDIGVKVEAFQKHRRTNEFWNTWSMHDNFAKLCVKHCSANLIKTSWDDIQTVETAIVELEKANQKLQAMQTAMLSV